MIYCRQCGHQVHETAAACPSCGGLVAAPVARPQAATGFKAYASFTGRIGRQTYWLQYALPIGIGGAVLQVLLARANEPVLEFVVTVSVFVISLAGMVKRCHDRNRSGWFYFIALIPIVGAIWLLVELGFLRGTRGPNRFGEDPLVVGYPVLPGASVSR